VYKRIILFFFILTHLDFIDFIVSTKKKIKRRILEIDKSRKEIEKDIRVNKIIPANMIFLFLSSKRI
jgi:hypothetical protein